nr:MAG TPA: hypothetical protein [Caudoviricetes sp.]
MSNELSFAIYITPFLKFVLIFYHIAKYKKRL